MPLDQRVECAVDAAPCEQHQVVVVPVAVPARLVASTAARNQSELSSMQLHRAGQCANHPKGSVGILPQLGPRRPRGRPWTKRETAARGPARIALAIRLRAARSREETVFGEVRVSTAISPAVRSSSSVSTKTSCFSSSSLARARARACRASLSARASSGR